MPQFETSTYSAQIFWLILCFFSLWFALSWFIIPKIEDIIKQRRTKIDGYIQKAEKTNKQALLSLEKYEQALKQAKMQAQESVAESEKALQTELNGKRHDLQKRLSRQIAEQETLLKEQHAEVIQNIDDISLDLAVSALNKIGFSVTAAELRQDTDKE
jgi:F-type H+-transporting ATPase subunit b